MDSKLTLIEHAILECVKEIGIIVNEIDIPICMYEVLSSEDDTLCEDTSIITSYKYRFPQYSQIIKKMLNIYVPYIVDKLKEPNYIGLELSELPNEDYPISTPLANMKSCQDHLTELKYMYDKMTSEWNKDTKDSNSSKDKIKLLINFSYAYANALYRIFKICSLIILKDKPNLKDKFGYIDSRVSITLHTQIKYNIT